MHDPLKGKHVVIMGFARQGQALARWLPTIGANATVTDARTEDAFDLDLTPYRTNGTRFVLGEHPLSILDEADMLCISGGVPLEAPLVQEALRRGITVSNDAQLFLERCLAQTVGITGSAGKTTTTSLIGQMCRTAGRTTYVGGNIGDVLLDALPKINPTDIVVIELSSFQLDLMTVGPNVGAVLNVTPNHLDRHGTMEAYTRAKAHMIRHQRAADLAVLGKDDPGSAGLAGLAVGRVAWFSAQGQVKQGAYLEGDVLKVVGVSCPEGGTRAVVQRGDILLPGPHNVLNVLAGCAIAGAAGVGVEAMREAVRTFRGVPHRLEVVRDLHGVTWVNDSIATAPERVLAALRSYEAPLVLLLGGKDKNLPWETLAALAVQKARAVVTFGHAGPMIAAKLGDARRSSAGRLQTVQTVMTLDEAVERAAAVAQPGDVVLLSPGGTSYDAYHDFEQRGQHFRDLVAALG